MRNHFLHIIVVFILLYKTCYSQNPVIKNFGVDKGLPSSECYWSIEDSKGYIWICSDAGVVKYDGYHFITYNSGKGLPDNTVFKITEDNKGRIWFASFSGKLSYYDHTKDSIFVVPVNDKLIKYSSTAPVSINFDSNDTLWLSIYRKGVVKIAPPFYSDFISVRKDCTSFFIQQIDKDKFIEACDLKRINIESPMFLNKMGVKQEIIALMNTYMVHISITKFINGLAYFSNGKNLYKFDGNSISRILSNEVFEINSLYQDKKGLLWVSTKDKGLLLYDLSKSESSIKTFLPQESISSAMIDKNDGIWITSTSNGLYYIPAPQVASIGNTKVYYCYKVGNHVYSNDKTNRLCMYSSMKLSEQEKCFGDAWNIFPYDSGLVVMSSPSYLLDPLMGSKNIIWSKGDKGNNFNLVCVEELDDRYLIGADNTFACLIKIDKESGECVVMANNTPRIFDIEIVNDKIYFATNTGLYTYASGTLEKIKFENNKLAGRLTGIEQHNNLMFVSTNSNGIYVVNVANKIVREINESNGLISNVCKAILIDKNGSLWVGTNKGLVCYDLRKNNFSECYRITNRSGLLSNEINSISNSGNTIYVSTNSGINYFDVNEITKKIYIPVRIESIILSGNILSAQSNIVLEYNQNNLLINYKAICPLRSNELIYKYRLEGVDTIWNYTTNTFIQYAALPPGEYKFIVGIKADSNMLTNLTEVKFIIDKPWWLKWWFILSEVLVAILILFLAAKLIISYAKNKEAKKNEIKRTIIESELKALRAQMNPHFIFNSLNSIQNFVLKNETKNAQKYLSKFSKLIRSVLENSRNETILLSEELETLHLYLELEQLRADFGFDYRIEISESLKNSTIQIPTMILQPYIENAILHGVLTLSDRKGMIHINIFKEDRYLVFEIDDNGIGREEAQRIRQKKNLKRTSLGTIVTEERINNINRFGAFNISLNIEDKIQMNVPKGTKVTIKIKSWL